MNSSKPYILRALHEWITDNGCTPLILVSSDHADIQIPAGIDEDGKVVLNISYSATSQLEITDAGIMFDARFSGSSHHLYIPTTCILAIYARENGQGMMFNEDHDYEPDPTEPEDPPEKPKVSKDKSFLKVVK